MRIDGQSFRTLGVLWLVYGCIRIAAAVWMAMYSGTLTLMWGALLNRVPDPLAWMTFFHVALALAIAWSLVSAVFAFVAGAALVRGSVAARTLTAVAALIALPEWPFGLVLGIYSLVAMMTAASARPQPVQASSPRSVTPLRARESR